MPSVRLLAFVAVLFASACGDDGGGAIPDPPFVPSLLALRAEPDPIGGGRIVDAEGRHILLRGVNVNSFVDYWQGSDFPVVFPFTEEDADLMATVGWSAVRLLLSWSSLEPRPGEYDEAYLDEIAAAVDVLSERGIYTIVDLHQDAWGATLAARPDEMCVGESSPAIGWDGAPDWATFDAGAPRCETAGLREGSPAVLAAFDAFWNDASDETGVGIRSRYVAMLAHIAARFADDAAVAGYDLMNEPNAFSPAQQEAMAEMYGEAIEAIRAAETAAGGFHHLILFEPSALFSAIGSGPPPDFPRDRDVVYAPHIYTGGFDGGAITREAFQTAFDEAALFDGAPVLSGEWGTDPRRASDSEDEYFLAHQALQDEFQAHATLWTWRESCGDPHKVREALGGQLPYPWGEFEVDCTSNQVTGARQDLIDDLTRGYLRAAPGRVSSAAYDPATGVLQATGEEAAAGTSFVVFVPFAGVSASGTGLTGVTVEDGPGETAYVTGRANGGAWSLLTRPEI